MFQCATIIFIEKSLTKSKSLVFFFSVLFLSRRIEYYLSPVSWHQIVKNDLSSLRWTNEQVNRWVSEWEWANKCARTWSLHSRPDKQNSQPKKRLKIQFNGNARSIITFDFIWITFVTAISLDSYFFSVCSSSCCCWRCWFAFWSIYCTHNNVYM